MSRDQGKDPKIIYAIGNLYTGTFDANLSETNVREKPDIDNHA